MNSGRLCPPRHSEPRRDAGGDQRNRLSGDSLSRHRQDFPFLKITNEVLSEKGISLSLPPQATTTAENRREAGTQAQVDIFGEGMRDFWQSGPEESRHINYWLADNCFADYYTRTGLDYRQREMITFCFLAAQGGCEPQLTSHAAANMKIGNDKEQIGNAGSEVARAIRRKNKGDKLGAAEFCIHAIEMLSYSKQDPKNINRRKELSYAQEEILDYVMGDNLYKNDDQSIMKWYDAFLTK